MLKFLIKFLFFIGLVVGIVAAVFLYDLYEDIKDDIDKVVNYSPKQSSQFLDKNGNLLANTFKDENREYVKYDDIPARVIESLIAIEDTQFFEHYGVNPDAISRAAIKNLQSGGYSEGASTLTQQLVKLLILTREKTIIRKVKEALLSLRLETILSKEEILERYLNHVYFGHGYYGVKTASKGYFKKELYQLSLKEIAILVGLPRAPSFYDPTKNLQVSLARANQVITRLETLGWITQEQYVKAINETPIIYNQTLTQNSTAPYAVDYAIKELSNDFPDILSGGYKIYLTIDSKAQEIANEAIRTSYEDSKKRDFNIRQGSKNQADDKFTKELNAAMISIENNTGKIIAMVGGVDYNLSVFNRSTQSIRQAGSAIKPFLYQIALNEGFNPASQLFDIGRTYTYRENGVQKKWQPKNAGGNFQGIVSFRDSLTFSRNLSTLNLVTDVGIGTVTNELKRFGFKNVNPELSVALGAVNINMIEFSQAYSVLSNQGTQVKPYIVEQVIDKNGNITKFEPEELEITTPEQIYLITSILKDVVDRGTGRRARVAGLELAGKTGTTNENKDAWFCGYSPSIQTLVWFGNDDNSPMRRAEMGGTIAAPAFGYFYRKYLESHPEMPRTFTKPKDVYNGSFNGKNELFTDMSPLPDIDTQIIIETNESPDVMEF